MMMAGGWGRSLRRRRNAVWGPTSQGTRSDKDKVWMTNSYLDARAREEPVGEGGQGLPELLGRAAAVSLIKGLQVPCVFLWQGHGQSESEHRLGGTISLSALCPRISSRVTSPSL